MKTCLFVVDVQNGFVNENTKFVVRRIKSLLDENLFDFILFTKFMNQANSPFRKILDWDKLTTLDEQELVAQMKPFAKHVFTKTIYSGVNELTLDFIRKNRIERVFVVGIDTDGCVLKTACDLFEHNFPVSVLEYYSASTGGLKSHRSGISVLERLIGKNNIIKNQLDGKRSLPE